MLGFVVVLHVVMRNSHSPLLTSNTYKNIVFDMFLFINYEDLGKSTIPSTGSCFLL